ncbi:radical SAM protein [Acetobacter estunensis]|uniref:radical SAM protein n=1 Tax=Acetobacter estunensis TaxID=104097 RepID=UPI0034A0615F
MSSSNPSHLGARAASLLPAALDVSVTDYCNADCDFCGFAKSRMKGKPRHFIDADEFIRALPILSRRHISFVDFQGGEPLLHPRIVDMVAAVRRHDMKTNLITNGWSLPERACELADAGLKALFISIDSDDIALHEKNRGLRGVGERIRDGIAYMSARRIPVMASVTVSRLVDFAKLPDTLGSLGFSGVTFSYPRREAFDSSSLVFNEDSELIDFTDDELIEVLDRIVEMKKSFPVLNPTASIRDIQRHIRGEREHFPCVGGYKYFYMDWKLNVWRCEAWNQPMGSVFEFDKIADDRTPCTNCMMSCYRDSSTMMYAPLAATEALDYLAQAQVRQAAQSVFNRRVLESAKSTLQEAGLLFRMCRGYSAS